LKIFNEKKPEILFSVVKAKKNPYFNMVEEFKNSYVKLSKKLSSNILRRQDCPKVYEINASIYFYSRDFLKNKKNVSVTLPKKKMVYVMDDICGVDIDSKEDFQYIEYLINKKMVKI
jgi:CMP-N,N'-diacetyllegionaminic acid synthase